jgi:hypothetical protein
MADFQEQNHGLSLMADNKCSVVLVVDGDWGQGNLRSKKTHCFMWYWNGTLHSVSTSIYLVVFL